MRKYSSTLLIPRQPQVCQYCGTAFHAKPTLIKKGGGKYCGRSCQYAARRGHRFNPGDSLIDYFNHVVQKGPDCWIWTAVCNYDGYGTVQVKRKTLLGHRIAWELYQGPIPEGTDVLHSCDNPPCCNPGHLFLGTQNDNMLDRSRKGRTLHGESIVQSKLTEAQVLQLRQQGRPPYSERLKLADQWNVRIETINNVIYGKTWKHITP